MPGAAQMVDLSVYSAITEALGAPWWVLPTVIASIIFGAWLLRVVTAPITCRVCEGTKEADEEICRKCQSRRYAVTVTEAREAALRALMSFEGVDDVRGAAKTRTWLRERGVSDDDISSAPQFYLAVYDDKDEPLPSWNVILSRDEKSMTQEERFDHMVDVQRARFADF